jgi:hypothetical protein
MGSPHSGIGSPHSGIGDLSRFWLSSLCTLIYLFQIYF